MDQTLGLGKTFKASCRHLEKLDKIQANQKVSLTLSENPIYARPGGVCDATVNIQESLKLAPPMEQNSMNVANQTFGGRCTSPTKTTGIRYLARTSQRSLYNNDSGRTRKNQGSNVTRGRRGNVHAMEQETALSENNNSNSGRTFGSIQLADIKAKTYTRDEVYIKTFHREGDNKHTRHNFKV